jgi:hypothetical protein
MREFYLKSGNRCAFPGCKKALFNIKGIFVGQICHIEAAAPGGERFNRMQTNEQRRHVSNLLLMCYDHHVETNDESKFPVSTMVRIKTEHENVYSDVVGTMLLSVKDHTTLTEPLCPRNLNQLAKTLKWKLSKKEIEERLTELNEVIGRLAKVPIPSRELLLIIINRGDRGTGNADLQCSSPTFDRRRISKVTNSKSVFLSSTSATSRSTTTWMISAYSLSASLRRPLVGRYGEA